MAIAQPAQARTAKVHSRGEQPTMRAARYYGPGAALSLETVPLPQLSPREKLVRVLAAGVCHTELQLLQGTLNLGVSPLTLGHEIIGEVAELGESVADLPLGQRVIVYYYSPCHECAWCAAGQEQLCPNLGPQVGFSADGGFADYLRVPARNLLPLPDGLDPAEAAPLACSGAAALHAVRAVAEVQPGESVLVYGIGAVGLMLVQLARLSGARVFGIGRSPEKLALARELGAEATFNPHQQDVVADLLRATRSEGVDVVFEAVGSAETMANSVALLRRRGRLVFVGYGADRLRLNPLHLVLKELQFRGSLGNTLQELRDTLDLAASGQLHSIVSRRLPLEDVNQALASLRRGEVVGRIVLEPGTPAPPIITSLRAPPGAITTAAAPPPVPPVGAGQAPPVASKPGLSAGCGAGRPTVPTHPPAEVTSASPTPPSASRSSVGAGHAPPASEQTDLTAGTRAGDSAAGGACPAPTLIEPSDKPDESRTAPPETDSLRERPLEPDLLAFIARGLDTPRDDDEFNHLALRLFAYQFTHNPPYQAFCLRRGRTPDTVAHWRKIPAVPIAAFKETLLACEPIDGAQEFNSSGTTQPEKKSRHYHPSLAVYDLNASLNFAAHVLPDDAHLPMLVLFPTPEQLPNSSLAYWLALMARRFAADGGRWFVGPAGLDAPALAEALRTAEQRGEPLALLAASFGLVHFLDYCQSEQLQFRLPAGSRLMDTGGYKGKSRELPQAELYGLACQTLGLDPDYLVNMYGLTEHSTQFLDAVLRNRVRGQPHSRHKTVPPWARTLVLDPDTLQPVSAGQRGLLCHFDLANRASVLAVLSEDIGYEVEDGFQLLGRAGGTEARGCSIALDELLTATATVSPAS